MFNLRKHTPIIYTGGTYGTFLIYVLECLSKKKKDISLPFKRNGNSHLHEPSFMHKHKITKEFYLSHDNKSKFVKYHPKNLKDQVVSKEIDYLMGKVDKAILVYPSPDTVLLVINNYVSKIWESWLENEISNDSKERDIFLNNLYSNWDINSNTKIDDIPRWILREFLSFYLMPAWHDQLQWNLLDWYQHPNLCVVTVDDVLYNFEDTIIKLAEFCELSINNLHEMKKIHTKMIDLQVHKDKDKICNEIIENFINEVDYTFNNLSLVDEAWIQWTLRNQGYEIKCNNLNKFPSTIAGLKKVTYRV